MEDINVDWDIDADIASQKDELNARLEKIEARLTNLEKSRGGVVGSWDLPKKKPKKRKPPDEPPIREEDLMATIDVPDYIHTDFSDPLIFDFTSQRS